MKRLHQNEKARGLRGVRLIVAVSAIAGVVVATGLAQEANTPAAPIQASPANGSQVTLAATSANEVAPVVELTRASLDRHSPSIDAILQMVDGGVSTNVIKTYVESSLIPFDPTPADLLALKKHGVSDEIATAIIQRGAQIRDQLRQARAVAPAANPAPTPANTGYAGFDPEGYDFWWYHYAYPRTLASIDQRMAAFSSPYAYWDYHPFALRPSFALAYSYPPTLSFGFRGGGPTPHAWREPRGGNGPNPGHAVLRPPRSAR